MFIHFSKLFKLFLSLFDRSKAPSKFFCHFPPLFLQGFPSTRPVRLFCPFFFIYFMFSCITSCFFGKILNLLDFGFFVDSSHISWNWSMGFCYKLLYNWSWWFNLINLVNCENPTWGFCSIRSNLMKLACWIDLFDHYLVLSILFNDQLVNFLKIVQVVFQILGFFVRNSMLKPILWIWT